MSKTERQRRDRIPDERMARFEAVVLELVAREEAGSPVPDDEAQRMLQSALGWTKT
jgi:hypothetical protein